MGLAGPRRPIRVIEIEVDGHKIRGVLERVNDMVLVTSRQAQRSAPLNGRDPEAVARDLLQDMASSQALGAGPPANLPSHRPQAR